MRYDVTIDLYQDWVDHVIKLFHHQRQQLSSDLLPDEIALRFFLQTSPSEQAETRRDENKHRLQEIQHMILQNMDEVIVPDIRKRTGYKDDRFVFKWVYYEGEHIIEECSEYRIPL